MSTVTGNVGCDPAAMAKDAGVSLDVYTLARYIQSEVGNGSVGDRVAVGQAAVNRVKYVEKHGSITRLLLYRQGNARHPNYGKYGPIHGTTNGKTDISKHSYGRWAATSRDPSVADLRIAADILSGKIPDNYNRGADDQHGMDLLLKHYGVAKMAASLRARANDRKYWIGPTPGINHMHTWQYRYTPEIVPTSPDGKRLLDRAIAAISGNRTGPTVALAAYDDEDRRLTLDDDEAGDSSLARSPLAIISTAIIAGGIVLIAALHRMRRVYV